MRALAFLLLLVLGAVLIYINEAWIGTVCLAAAVVVLLAGFGRVGAKGAKAVWTGVKQDMGVEYEVFDRHSPEPVDASVFADVSRGLGGKAGEALGGNENYRYVSNRIAERSEKGVRNMYSAFKKLFKKGHPKPPPPPKE